MTIFSYKAINPNGNEIVGELEADSKDNANSILSSRGLIPTKVSKAVKASSSSQLSFIESLTSIKPQEIILFTKQFRTMLKSGVNNIIS